MFVFPYASYDRIGGFWVKESERRSLPWEQIETMMSALQQPGED